jgi:hypothetical protein
MKESTERWQKHILGTSAPTPLAGLRAVFRTDTFHLNGSLMRKQIFDMGTRLMRTLAARHTVQARAPLTTGVFPLWGRGGLRGGRKYGVKGMRDVR